MPALAPASATAAIARAGTRRRARRARSTGRGAGLGVASAGSCARIAPLEAAQLLAGLEPELVPKLPAPAAVDLERLHLPAGAVQREHELGPRPLAVRALLDERRELGDELLVATEHEPGLGPLLER